MILAWDARAVRWICDRFAARPYQGMVAAVAISGGDIIAGFSFENWRPEFGTIEFSAYAESPRWATRGIAAQLMAYAFEDVGARMVIAKTAVDNTRAQRCLRAMGAAEYTIPDLRAPGLGETIQTLTPAAWASSKLGRPRHGTRQG